MTGFHTNIEAETLANNNFRKVLFTAPHSQLVLMSLLPSEDIGMEVHHDVDQLFRFEAGTGKAILNGEEITLKDGDVVVRFCRKSTFIRTAGFMMPSDRNIGRTILNAFICPLLPK